MTEAAKLPDGVDQADLYEGPKPGENVVAMPPPRHDPTQQIGQMAVGLNVPQPSYPQAQLSPIAEIKRSYPAVLIAALDVLSARLLGLIAVVAACGIWSFAVWDPNPVRTIAAGLFSVTVLGPIVALYWKAGITGGGA
jgi:hypothetical protein